MPVDSQSVDSQPVDAPVAVPPWMLVQTTGHFGATATVAATGAGNLIVVGIETGATNTVTAVTDNAGNVYTPIERAINSVGGFGVELWSATNSNPGATTITATASTVFATVAWEVDGIRTTGALDTSSKVDNQPSSTTPFGASITTSAAGSLVISVVIVDNTVSGIHAGSPFTNDHKTFGNGWAHLTDPAAPAGAYRAQWDQAISGISCAASAAFLAGP